MIYNRPSLDDNILNMSQYDYQKYTEHTTIWLKTKAQELQ